MNSKERIAKALSISTDTKVFEMGQGVSERTPEIFKEYFPGRKAVILADVHTWPILGERTAEQERAGADVYDYTARDMAAHNLLSDWLSMGGPGHKWGRPANNAEPEEEVEQEQPPVQEEEEEASQNFIKKKFKSNVWIREMFI